ncbi:MAG: selenide, water dikinase SelD [Bacteroidota bacterium]
MNSSNVKLTAYSHGAGCGCKIAPAVLSEILKGVDTPFLSPHLLVGNNTRDDAAVYQLDESTAIISTTDFFMPIVDDPVDFGAIASVNSLSDIYAMGGQPLMAIAILGWPIDKLNPEIAGQVMQGATQACSKAGIPIGGGHSIDAPEPIFGLAVTGKVHPDQLKTNTAASAGCELFITKPLGVGILSTAQKKGILEQEDFERMRSQMLQLNVAGAAFSKLNSVKSMTDVTGFGLLGHLLEMCEGSEVYAELWMDKVPLIPNLTTYIQANSLPGGTYRNFASYGEKVSPLTDYQKAILCDPQTSGGLLVAVTPEGKAEFLEVSRETGVSLDSIGVLKKEGSYRIEVK